MTEIQVYDGTGEKTWYKPSNCEIGLSYAVDGIKYFEQGVVLLDLERRIVRYAIQSDEATPGINHLLKLRKESMKGVKKNFDITIDTDKRIVNFHNCLVDVYRTQDGEKVSSFEFVIQSDEVFVAMIKRF